MPEQPIRTGWLSGLVGMAVLVAMVMGLGFYLALLVWAFLFGWGLAP